MSPESPKILVTGATGFIGQAFCKELVGRGFNVQVLLRDPADFSKIPLALGAGMILGSLENENSLSVACAGRDLIIHLAGIAHVGKAATKKRFNPNLEGTKNLLSAAIQAKVRRIIFLSSSLAEAAAMGKGDVTDYGTSKLEAEKLLQQAAAEDKIDVTILRAVNVYGPGMKGNISLMIKMIHSRRLPPLPEICNRISLVSVQDLVKALFLAMETKVPGSSPITVTDDEQYSIAEIESAIYQNLGRAIPQWRTPAVVLYCASLFAGGVSAITGWGSISSRTYRNLTNDNVFSNDRAKQELGFQPSTTFYQSLPEIISTMRD